MESSELWLVQPVLPPTSLISPQGIVTRVGDVKPLMEVACYTCDACGFEIYQEVTGESFMPIARCPTPSCLNHSGQAPLHLQTQACKACPLCRVALCSCFHLF